MTYLQFLLWLVVPPVCLLLALASRTTADAKSIEAAKALSIIVFIVLSYAILWDVYMISLGIWTYGTDAVSARIGLIPIEELAFMILQPILVGLMYFVLRRHMLFRAPPSPPDRRLKPVLTTLMIVVAVIGAALQFGSQRAAYLGLILVWCGPVLAILAWLGLDKIWPERRLIAVSIAIPTLYLWGADWIALAEGVWSISDRYSLGIDPFGLPLEEAIFFLVTNWMIVQGLAMLLPDHPAYATR